MSTDKQRLTLVAPKELEELAGAALFAAGAAGVETRDESTLHASEEGTIALSWICSGTEVATFIETLEGTLRQFGVDLDVRGALSQEPVEETDWSERWKEGLEPVELGAFYVTTTWDDSPAPPHLRPLRIDPGMAFGTGLHATTQLAAGALSSLKERSFAPDSVLDMGSGTGILAMMAAHLFGAPVDAVEIDPQALEASKEIIEGNGFKGLVSPMDSLPEGKRYDLIVANINAEALNGLAPTLTQRAHRGGKIILTGILDHLAEEVKKTYGLPVEKTVSAQEWVLFVLTPGDPTFFGE